MPKLPLPIKIEGDPRADQISRINEITAVGRGNWFALLAYLAFAGVTILSVDDLDFFLASRQTTLPLVGVAIPTFSFFVFGPVLGTALYIYLHLHIRKLAEALCLPKSTDPDIGPLENQVSTWLLNDFILRLRNDGSCLERPLDSLADLATLSLVWLAGPVVMIGFFTRSLPAHSLLLTSAIWGLAVLTLVVGLVSYLSVQQAANGRRATGVDRPRNLSLLVGLLLGVGATIGAVKTEFGCIATSDRHWACPLLASADLRDVTFATLPPETLNYEDARFSYRETWCAQYGYPAEVCHRLAPRSAESWSDLAPSMENWCIDEALSVELCVERLQIREIIFESAWSAYRATVYAAATPPDLSGADLRNARFNRANMIGVDLSDARLNGATFVNAVLQGVDMSRASLDNANLVGADLQGARLFAATLNGSDLQFSNLIDVDLTRATGFGTRFDNAN